MNQKLVHMKEKQKNCITSKNSVISIPDFDNIEKTSKIKLTFFSLDKISFSMPEFLN